MRVVHVNIARPRIRSEPEALIAAWPTLHDVAAAVRRAGAEVTVVQSFHRAAELVLDGVRYRFAPEPALPGRPTGLSPWAVAAAVKAARPEIVHVNGLDFGWHARVLCGLGVPVLAQDHASRAERASARRRWGLRKIAAAAFTDARQAAPFFARGDLRPNLPVFSVPESSTWFTPGDQPAARGMRPRRRSGRALGRAVQFEQGPADGAGRGRTRGPGAAGAEALVLPPGGRPAAPGQGPHRRLAGPGQKVRLLGRVEHPEVETLCRAADIFMLASHHESAGYALMEALACGATPVVSDIPSFRRLTGEGRVGLLAPVEDVEAFARALVGLAQAPRADLRRRATAHFERELSFDAVGAQLLAAYEDVIARAR